MGFGERMQREREMRGISLEEIASATKIGARSLRALEQEDFDKLPGGIFNKGFVRSYARYLGIDEEQAVTDYMVACGESQEKDERDAEKLKSLGANWKSSSPDVSDKLVRVPWFSLLVLLLLVAAAAAGWHYRRPALDAYHGWQARRHQRAQSVAEPTPNLALPTATPVAVATPEASVSPSPTSADTPLGGIAAATPTATPSPTPTPAPAKAKASPTVSPTPAEAASGNDAAPGEGEFVVAIRTRDESWVSVTVDGKTVKRGVMSANTRFQVKGRQKITVVAGNAGGIDLSFNGKPQPALGNDKEVRSATFTRDGKLE